MLAPALAGCVSSGSDAGLTSVDQDAPSQVVVEAEPGVFVSDNRGVLKGRIVNDVGFGVPGARVSVLGTDFFADSDPAGRFSIDNVSLGNHSVLAQADGFHPGDTTVDITAGNVTHIEILLVPKAERGAGYNPHLHDYWGQKDVITLMDEGYELGDEPNGNPGYGYSNDASRLLTRPNRNTTMWRVALPLALDGGVPPIVLPGTQQLEVTLEWAASDVPMERFGFAYSTAGTSRLTVMGHGPSGTTFIIPVAPGHADSGHQKFTLWTLWIYTPNNAGDAGWTPGHGLGSVQILINAVRGDLYLEDPHENKWGEEDSLVLIKDVKRSTTPCCQQRDGRRDTHTFVIEDGLLVPPGAVRMVIDFRYEYDGGATPVDFEYDMTWLTGGQDPARTPVGEFSRHDPVTSEPGHKVWDFELAPHETDAFYQRRSNWMFMGWIKEFPEDGPWLESRARDLTLEVTVFRDPSFDAGSA